MNVTSTPIKVERLRPPVGLSWWKRVTWVQLWMVLEPVRIEIGAGNHHHVIEVDAGLITDFASIPKPLKWFFPDYIVYGTGAFAHDQLYKTGEVGKRVADGLLAWLLIEYDEACQVTAEIVFLGVHLFGFRAWNQHRKEDGKS